MADMEIKLNWTTPDVGAKCRSGHVLHFSNEISVTADAAPDWGGDAKKVNPEQLLAASLSSCHMMTFLALAGKADWQVVGYEDTAVAKLGKGANGRMTVTALSLSPEVIFAQGADVSVGELSAMHERAHRYCFVANAISATMTVKPVHRSSSGNSVDKTGNISSEDPDHS